ncbi:MAG: YIP1 family protein [candidate division Zixibacteria bacterium]|nr:YIP1 family protein [candidate division Zixibacteria bacterium]
MENDSSALAVPAPAIGNHGGLLTTLLTLFWSPSTAFHTLREKRWWFVPFLLCAATAVLFEFATSHYRMEDLKQDIKSDPSYSSEEVGRRLANIERQATGGVSLWQLGLATTTLAAGHAAKMFGLALVVWLPLQLYATRITYMTIVSVCSFIFLIKIPEALLSGLLIRLKGTTRVFLGPAALLPSDWFGSPLFSLLERLDIFSIWMAILLAMALPIVAELPRKKATMIVVYLWVVWLLEGALLGNLFRIV